MEGSLQFVFNAFIGVIKTKLWTGIIDGNGFFIERLNTEESEIHLPTEM
jgi:hypothetical protein